jgi:hypothetical protein
MPILSQTLKGHNSETVRLFELKNFVRMYFGQLYQRGFGDRPVDRDRRVEHASLKVSETDGPAMPYPFTPCQQTPLRQPYTYGCFSGGRLQSERPASILYPLGYPAPYASAAKK